MYLIAVICGQWTLFVDNGRYLWTMDVICGQWTLFVDNGRYLWTLAHEFGQLGTGLSWFR